MPNSEIVIQTVSHFFEGVSLPGIGGRIVSAAGQIMIDMFSNNITLFFNILRSANAFLSEGAGIGLILTAAGLLLAFLYQIFINNLLLIGEKRFFMEIHSYRGDHDLKDFLSVQAALPAQACMGHVLPYPFSVSLGSDDRRRYHQTL